MKYEKEGLKADVRQFNFALSHRYFKATGNDKPPSYDKVVVTEETDTKA